MPDWCTHNLWTGRRQHANGILQGNQPIKLLVQATVAQQLAPSCLFYWAVALRSADHAAGGAAIACPRQRQRRPAACLPPLQPVSAAAWPLHAAAAAAAAQLPVAAARRLLAAPTGHS